MFAFLFFDVLLLFSHQLQVGVAPVTLSSLGVKYSDTVINQLISSTAGQTGSTIKFVCNTAGTLRKFQIIIFYVARFFFFFLRCGQHLFDISISI